MPQLRSISPRSTGFLFAARLGATFRDRGKRDLALLYVPELPDLALSCGGKDCFFFFPLE